MNGREIITVAQMRAIDAAAPAAGAPTRALMENAGRAVAAVVAERFSPRPLTVLCGPGANGGDGYVAARALAERGWPVRVGALAARERLAGDAADAAAAWSGPTAPLDQIADDSELYLDALFGAGLARPLADEAARWANLLSARAERVVAVDVPSGLSADTGRPLGEACMRAALSVTFERKKPGHVLLPGREFCGVVEVRPIGVPQAVWDAQSVALWENHPDLWLGAFPWPRAETHKHARGHVAVASGPASRSGAARLAARAALRAGAGLVTVFSPLDALAEHAARLDAVMLAGVADAAQWAGAARDKQALVVGPAFGVGDAARAALAAMLAAPGRGPAVLDADALTIIGAGAGPAVGAHDVMTPHVGEFRRVFAGLLETAPSRIEAARAAARSAGCTVLLKGPDTVIAAPDGRAVVNTTGSPFLATAGSGDVLSGLIAGLLAQGMAGFEAAAAAAWLHGAAGERLGPGLIAEDLPEALPSLLNHLAPQRLQARR